jgi:hypothetical protein
LEFFMRYFEFATLSEGIGPVIKPPVGRGERAGFEAARVGLEKLGRERVRKLAAAVQRELRRYLAHSEIERLELEYRVGW